jgi:hypothetical protein
MIGRCRVNTVRDKRALVRPDGSNEFEKVREGIAFDIELDARKVAEIVCQLMDISGPDVSLIWSRMHRDAVRPGGNAQLGGPNYAGDPDASRVPEQRHFVQIDAKSGHRLWSAA